mmetsp:Transcript_107087/g.190261  ORF Transcript_107087/g.190261 Transcript_107087/m.190261 type:complete len:786 (-) Transcript_107087:52-2409(-)|eukprot:CAMPEP_0197654830 /NCGR_PEP_ID=MMETSP1338-20131121/39081_1 /TAXON_ID=43686 ORGANISM="Pelagodinium beii, Strain RCC1491" /NCGR_SAMPLE_ID=MMETSP1338 /ASSEMBLY_ACC=CAM_ASM_000754 /LENGTH=785 /DNA_ID=CAMNT_0043230347 /DNA_START=80 /DNA_END=2437 /DNA_ORIENTATION=+
MNARTISLPDLVTEKKRNTALSLSEGFAGGGHAQSLASTTVGPWPGRPGKKVFQGVDEGDGTGLVSVLPIYYRCRQLVLGTEKGGHRVPVKMMTELRSLEKSVGREIRALHPLLFQRFDDIQLDRLLRAMPFLRLSSGRWIFGSENLVVAWPKSQGQRSFILLQGRIALYLDPNGVGERQEITRGAIFGEKHFRLGDESMSDVVAGAAHCEEPCIVGVLSSDVLEATFADRAFGNRRIAQKVRHSPALSRVVLPDPDPNQPKIDFDTMTMEQKSKMFEEKGTGAVKNALEQMSKVATAVHVLPGRELLADEPLEDSVLMVSQGSIEVRGDVTLTEKLDALPPKKKRMRIYLDKAEKLAGDSIFDKLDPYCIVKLGEFKRFQTPVMWNVGTSPKFDYNGVLTYSGEEEIEFTVMDHDKFSADDLCGSVTMKIADLYDGWTGKLELQRPARALGAGKDDQQMMEFAGKLFLTVRYDYEKLSSLTRPPKERTWTDQVLFTIRKDDSWGHETIMLGKIFQRTLEGATAQMAHALQLSNFHIVGGQQRGANDKITLLKVSKLRFIDFVKKSQREKQFLQACRGSALDKQSTIKSLAKRLTEKWEQEEHAELMRKGIFDNTPQEEVVEPSKFRVAYRGAKANIAIRNALNLSGGGWFDKLDPYAILRFRGSKSEFRTSVLEDAGNDPIWNCEGTLAYNGEVALEISVWDYDKYSADDLIATGVIQVEQFCNGFEGMVPLSLPGDKKKKKALKQSMIIVGIMWDPPEEPKKNNKLMDATFSSTGMGNMKALM